MAPEGRERPVRAEERKSQDEDAGGTPPVALMAKERPLGVGPGRMASPPVVLAPIPAAVSAAAALCVGVGAKEWKAPTFAL